MLLYYVWVRIVQKLFKATVGELTEIPKHEIDAEVRAPARTRDSGSETDSDSDTDEG